MTAKARITSEFATANDVADRLRIPAHRVDELRRQMYDLAITHPNGGITIFEIKHSRGSKSGSVRRKSARRAASAAKKR